MIDAILNAIYYGKMAYRETRADQRRTKDLYNNQTGKAILIAVIVVALIFGGLVLRLESANACGFEHGQTIKQQKIACATTQTIGAFVETKTNIH